MIPDHPGHERSEAEPRKAGGFLRRALAPAAAAVERLLRRGTTELDARERELVQFERELAERETRVQAREDDVNRRRGELGAVELKRAALEQREKAVEAREEALAARDAESQAEGSTSVEHEVSGPVVLFVPGPRYQLVDRDAGVRPGEVVEIEGFEYEAVRVGRSPLPGDTRP